MFQILLAVILPFAPIWMYGDIWHADRGIVKGVEKTVCGAQDPACSDKKSAEVRTGKSSEDGFSGFGGGSLFPVDKALASGLQPVRKSGTLDVILWAGSSVAIDVASGTILHYDNGRKRTQIASLTKMMTAVLAMEKIKDLEEPVGIKREGLNLAGTVVGCPTSTFCPSNRLYVGEKVKAIDLMKAMLMNSANDAAASLAIHIAGTEKEFVGMMNDKAASLGLKDTHFCTSSGLELDGKEDQCYSSAYDIARIAAYSLQYETIWNIMQIPEGRFYSCDGKYMHELKNTDMLLETMDSCIGGKTGFTPMAGKSLLIGAKDPTGKHTIIAVVLNDDKRWDDMKFLVDWVFTSFTWK